MLDRERGLRIMNAYGQKLLATSPGCTRTYLYSIYGLTAQTTNRMFTIVLQICRVLFRQGKILFYLFVCFDFLDGFWCDCGSDEKSIGRDEFESVAA